VSVRISAAERDALYEQIFVRLSGIDAVWLAAAAGDFEEAERLGREYCDELRLLSDDLGWGEGSGESIELATPPDVLHRVLTRLRGLAEAQRAEEQRERAEWHEREEETQRVLGVCERLLGAG
jgi:hypothetical protein